MWVIPKNLKSEHLPLEIKESGNLFEKSLMFRSKASSSRYWVLRFKKETYKNLKDNFYLQNPPSIEEIKPYFKKEESRQISKSDLDFDLLREKMKKRFRDIEVLQINGSKIEEEITSPYGFLNPRWVETLMGLPVGWTKPDSNFVYKFERKKRKKLKVKGGNWSTPTSGESHKISNNPFNKGQRGLSNDLKLRLGLNKR